MTLDNFVTYLDLSTKDEVRIFCEGVVVYAGQYGLFLKNGLCGMSEHSFDMLEHSADGTFTFWVHKEEQGEQ